jgi:muramoyltetrapeptide carboxypeptidase
MGSIFPELPKPGDTIGVIAPASSFDKEKFAAGCEHLRRLGYKVFFHESIFEKENYFAGTAERRAWELHQMFEKRFVKGIICARGGYGSNYLLPLLNTQVIASNPKMLMGYSDITSLLTYIHDKTGLVTIHGPMVAKDFADAAQDVRFDAELNTEVSGMQIREGTARGKLYGGCLSMLVASLGTPYEINTAGTVLFIEDIATKSFQVDRMLMHLKLAGKLREVNGIVFGEMADCGDLALLQETIRSVLKDFSGPVGFGLRSGHLSDYRNPGVTLPIGVDVELEVRAGVMSLRRAIIGASASE